MPDDHLLVRFNALERASVDIGSAIHKIRSGLENLDQDARPLFNTWGGAAFDQYDLRQKKWTTTANDLIMILTDIRTKLDESLVSYVDAENRGRTLFS
ncbi:MAG: WXG100 family type VII secretion target [Dactylosporangium sp.]|nr:WXG100 family type VII secretion target [Dactylosporangium sp.]NNJ61989.1 WXG100 family type VII secretion target [Dactylosporangium sp.]